jgi:DNA gyrase subunit B
LTLEKMIYLPTVTPERFQDEAWLRHWASQLEERLNADDSGATRYRISLIVEPEREVPSLAVRRTHHGLATDKIIQREFFASGEYRAIAALGEQLDGLIGDGAHIQRGERREDVTSFKQAINWLLNDAKRGQSIQRYKGLGEMNPGQLWETTMDPDSRRLLQVKIEDAVGADDIFTMLMGDQVEPRREFIEKNALDVAHLDV